MLAIAGLLEEGNDSVSRVVSLCVQCLVITLCLVLKTVMMQHIVLIFFPAMCCYNPKPSARTSTGLGLQQWFVEDN